MKSFQPKAGSEMIQKICALKDDFSRQVAKTRLVIYKLIRSLMTTPETASDLQHRHGVSAGFMVDLLQLCRSERDPDCLMLWFEILKIFMTDFSPSKDLLDEVYGNFKQYFPIALPRASQTGVTPEELKLQLRNCFSASHQLADSVFPFLLGKLDQGEGVTVNVKVSQRSRMSRPSARMLTLLRSISSRPLKLALMNTAILINPSLFTWTEYGTA